MLRLESSGIDYLLGIAASLLYHLPLCPLSLPRRYLLLRFFCPSHLASGIIGQFLVAIGQVMSGLQEVPTPTLTLIGHDWFTGGPNPNPDRHISHHSNSDLAITETLGNEQHLCTAMQKS